ncbi:hypothetical protein BJV82DRAFT_666211 [Fennellomyces sp. T-0311]|nr:hypothetical protein BJV82DRAFT_666211 [Fennellomyces sp. T-0311]
MRHILVMLLLPLAAFGFEFKNILFGGSDEDQHTAFGVRESRRTPLPVLDACDGYVCQQPNGAVCVDRPIDCPCPHPLDHKQAAGDDWYACVRTGL